jgi:hypothetical protein
MFASVVLFIFFCGKWDRYATYRRSAGYRELEIEFHACLAHDEAAYNRLRVRFGGGFKTNVALAQPPSSSLRLLEDEDHAQPDADCFRVENKTCPSHIYVMIRLGASTIAS